MSEITIPNCEHCQTPLQKHPQKNYYVCPKWLPNNQGCPGMIWWPEGTRKQNYPVVAFSYKVPSKSMPGVMRQVKIYESGDVECSCWAGQVDKWCRHRRIMIEDIEKLLEKIKKAIELKPTEIRKAKAELVELFKIPVSKQTPKQLARIEELNRFVGIVKK